MHVSPFLELFIAFFALLGAGLGWFTRIRVILLALGVAMLVFGALVVLSAFDPPASPELTVDDVQVSAFIAALATIPALLAAAIARLIKKRKSQ